MLDPAIEKQVIIRVHGMPGAMGVDFDTAFQAHQGDGANDGMRRQLFACEHAQAHDFEIRRALLAVARIGTRLRITDASWEND